MRTAQQAIRWGAFCAVLAMAGILPPRVRADGAAAGASSDWLADVQRAIQAQEYRVTWQPQALTPGGPAWHAANRAQDLRVYFRPGGVETLRRTDAAKGPLWQFQLESWGRNGALQQAAEPRFETSGTRIDLVRKGIVERYDNRPSGLEQSFILASRPEGNGPLVLTARMSSGLRAAQSKDDAILFTQSGKIVVAYDKLRVTDAAGRAYPASMRFKNSRLRLEVDDHRAVYPLTIDPTLTGPGGVATRTSGVSTVADWTYEGSFEDEALGRAVGTAGDVNGDGYSDVFVTSPYYDGGLRWQGRVDVFYGSASGPASTPGWTFLGETASDELGRSVSTAGDVNGDGYADLLVAAYYYEEGEGKVYVFYGSSSGLAAAPAWTAESNQSYAEFGETVSPAGDVNGDGYSDVMVCARYYTNTISEEGAAFIWFGSASGLGDPGTPANADWVVYGGTDSAYLERIGYAGDINGDGYSDVLVGMPLYDNGDRDEGLVRLYHGSPTGPSTTPNWTASTTNANANLGDSVGSAGDFNGDGYGDVFVGTDGFDNPLGTQGAVFVWFGSSTGLGDDGTPDNADAAMFPTDAYSSHFAMAASPAGDANGDGYGDIIIGAPWYRNGQVYEGAAFLWCGQASPPAWVSSDLATWSREGNTEGVHFGHRVATAGDVNGDGFSDFILQESGYDGVTTDTGRVLLYYGAADGLSTSSQWNVYGAQEGAQLGISVDGAGDVNGDGFADVIVGAPGYDNGNNNEGRAYLYLGTSTGLAETPVWTGEGQQDGAWYGIAVSGAGDVNADGYADILVGAWYYDDTYTNEGAAFLYYGGPSGPAFDGTPASADWTGHGGQQGAFYGMSLDALGDVNGDGYGDVIVAAPYYDADVGTSQTGAVYAYYGSASGLSATADWDLIPTQALAYMGWSARGAGDVNGDGYSDAIFSAPGADLGESHDVGAVFVYPGSASGLVENATAAWGAHGDAENQRFGTSVDGVGDFNGDGYGDIVVGATPLTGVTHAYVWYGSASGLSGTGIPSNADKTIAGPADMGLGYSCAGVGDLNGDGYADLAVGAPLLAPGPSPDVLGAVYVGYGGPSSAPGLAGQTEWLFGDQDGCRFGVAVAGAGDVNGDGFADLLVGSHYYDNPSNNEGAARLYYGGGKIGQAVRLRQQRVATDHLVAPLGFVPGRFRASAQAIDSYGLMPSHAKFECKPIGTAFDGTDLIDTPLWQAGGPITITSPAPPFTQVVHGAGSGMHRWRVRFVADGILTPLAHDSRWYAIPNRGWSDGTIRLGDAQSYFLGTQGISITADGTYWAGAFNYTLSDWDNTVNVAVDAVMQYQMPAAQWVGIYLYDYTGATWVEGYYIYKQALN